MNNKLTYLNGFYANKIEKLTVPSNVKEIGPSAFGYNYGLKNLILNEGLETIGSGAFSHNFIKGIWYNFY